MEYTVNVVPQGLMGSELWVIFLNGACVAQWSTPGDWLVRCSAGTNEAPTTLVVTKPPSAAYGAYEVRWRGVAAPQGGPGAYRRYLGNFTAV